MLFIRWVNHRELNCAHIRVRGSLLITYASKFRLLLWTRLLHKNGIFRSAEAYEAPCRTFTSTFSQYHKWLLHQWWVLRSDYLGFLEKQGIFRRNGSAYGNSLRGAGNCPFPIEKRRGCAFSLFGKLLHLWRSKGIQDGPFGYWTRSSGTAYQLSRVGWGKSGWNGWKYGKYLSL